MILAVVFSIGLFTLLLDQESYADIPQEEQSKITSHIVKLYIAFIANQGQIDKSVGYYAKTLGGNRSLQGIGRRSFPDFSSAAKEIGAAKPAI